MLYSIKDSFKINLEAASGGKNTVIYDDGGNASVMVAIPKFKLSDIDSTWPSTVHPAFIVNGVEKDCIYISKYINCLANGYGVSLPAQDPATSVTFDAARAACDKKGTGWHIMNNAEWSAVALWSWKNGTMPRGNNNYGSDISAPYEHGVATAHDSSGVILRTGTGTGPISWNHDNTPWGISDLNGNIWEWNDGLKLIDGKIYVFGQDSTPMNNYTTANTHMDATGWLDTGYYYDSVAVGNANKTGANIGAPMLNTSLTHPEYTGGSTDEYFAEADCEFEKMAAASGVTVSDMMKYLCLFPPETGLGGDYLWTRNYGERLLLRGGDWYYRAHAGVFGLHLIFARTCAYDTIGFRAAFVA